MCDPSAHILFKRNITVISFAVYFRSFKKRKKRKENMVPPLTDQKLVLKYIVYYM